MIDKKYKPQLFNDSYQNFKKYQIPKAQLILSDIPFGIGENAYGSNPRWYNGGDNKNGESNLAKKAFFNSDYSFKPAEFLHFSVQMLRKDPKEAGKAPCLIIFCEYEQQFELIRQGKNYGLIHYIPLVFRKNYSPQVLKANMKIVGNCEYGILLYRDKLPKFNNDGQMIFNCMEYPRDTGTPRIHPTQKSVPLLERLIEIFTDKDDVVIDPCSGSGSTLLAAANLSRRSFGFEIDKGFYEKANSILLKRINPKLFT